MANVKLAFIDSLNLNHTSYRVEDIVSAHVRTFSWIYENLDLGFVTWLRLSQGIYWIRGKPGSGKSTLMKYIFNHQRTQELFHEGITGPTHRLLSGFFFHDRGSYMQKSIEGLLHSVLYQVLREVPEFAKMIFPIYRAGKPPQLPSWSISDLQKCLNFLLRQKTIRMDICLFLDALDEYEGGPEAIASFIKTVANPPIDSATRIKVCFSSRPLNIFVDEFELCPGFRIHEQTLNDISSYTSSRMKDNKRMDQLLSSTDSKQRDAAKALETEVKMRAEGVFLWVRLVLDDLLSACTNGDSIESLTDLLSSIPNGLQDFYERITSKIPQMYRYDAYIMLEVVLRSETLLTLDEFSATLACASRPSFEDCLVQLRSERLRPTKVDDITRIIKSRCGGLIEIIYARDTAREGIKNVTRDSTVYVQLMHQSVKDFLGKPQASKHILGPDHPLPSENGYSYLTKYLLAFNHREHQIEVSQNAPENRLRAGSASIPEASIPYRYRIVLVNIARIDIVSI
jgi:hypothetical protein